MKVVFIQPNVGFKGHTWEAIGIGYLAAYLKQNCKDVDISFYSAFYDSDVDIIKNSLDADVVAFSATSPQFHHGIQLANQIKNDHNIIVFGGAHASALPEDVLQEPNIDVAVKGEGERSILSIVKDVQAGNIISVYKKIICSEYIKDINTIPFPDRIVIKNERNIQQAYVDNKKRITSVLSSRGCPFKCSFCCSNTIWGRKTRFRSPDNILDEVEALIRNQNIQFLKFADDTFTANKNRIMEFCRLKTERGLNIPFGANAHINTIDEDLLKVMSDNNCEELWYGVESGSPRILKDMHKTIKIEDVKRIFKLTKDYGMKTRAYFLLGMPNETIDDIYMTERLCDEIDPDIVGFTLLSPYPINEHYDHIIMKDWDWSTFDEYNNDWVHTQTLSNEQLKIEQKRLVDKSQKKITFRQKDEK